MCARYWSVPLLATLAAATGAAAVERPVAVSPGSATGSMIESRCPTFSWNAVEGAEGHELLVYEVGSRGQESEPLLIEKLPGSASSWTPSLDRCLERGGRYAWSVGVVGRDEASTWSAPRLFEVAPAPSAAEIEQALAVVRRYLEARGDSTGDSVRVDGLTTPFPSLVEADEVPGSPAAQTRGTSSQGIIILGGSVLSGYRRKVSPLTACSPGAFCSRTVDCISSEKALGGGAFSLNNAMRMVWSYPQTDWGWQTKILNTSGADLMWEAWVVCAATH